MHSKEKVKLLVINTCMRLSEIVKEAEDFDLECPRCYGLGHTPSGDRECPDCKGTGNKAELEEIKVTKTVAGSKQPPSRKLAMDKKKKSPNQGKKPVEIDKMPDAKDLATITLKGEYNQRTK